MAINQAGRLCPPESPSSSFLELTLALDLRSGSRLPKSFLSLFGLTLLTFDLAFAFALPFALIFSLSLTAVGL